MLDVLTSFTTLTYKEPVPVRGAVISLNRFLKVTLLEVDYYISVLPKFHDATLEEINFKLKKFFSQYELNFRNIDLTKRFFNLVESDDFLDSIKNETLFNIECLLTGILRKTNPELFTNNLFLVNDLYRPSVGPRGYAESKCLKIKISPTSIEKTIRLITELHIHNPELILRLDGNRMFEVNELIQFEKMLKQNIAETSFKKIDYIEEPFKNFNDTFLFQKRSELKIAMDESFATLMSLKENELPENVAIVVKPSLYGISTINNWMETHTKKRIIISSSFEHPSVKIGLDFLASLRPLEFHGLENFL